MREPGSGRSVSRPVRAAGARSGPAAPGAPTAASRGTAGGETSGASSSGPLSVKSGRSRRAAAAVERRLAPEAGARGRNAARGRRRRRSPSSKSRSGPIGCVRDLDGQIDAAAASTDEQELVAAVAAAIDAAKTDVVALRTPHYGRWRRWRGFGDCGARGGAAGIGRGTGRTRAASSSRAESPRAARRPRRFSGSEWPIASSDASASRSRPSSYSRRARESQTSDASGTGNGSSATAGPRHVAARMDGQPVRAASARSRRRRRPWRGRRATPVAIHAARDDAALPAALGPSTRVGRRRRHANARGAPASARSG